MRRKVFSEEQIIEIPRLHQAGAKPVALCRQHGITEATLYNWRSRYGGMEVSDAKRLRALDGEPEAEEVYRLHPEGGLAVKRWRGAWRVIGVGTPIVVPKELNQRWLLDLVGYQLANWRFRLLEAIDDFNSE